MKQLPKLTWLDLYAYQFYADQNGHGESWRKLCKERTQRAANVAWQDWEKKNQMATPWENAMPRVNDLISEKFNVPS